MCIWNWEEGVKLRSFKNRNPAGTRITAIELINDHDLALLLTATDDGLIRVWRNLEQAETTNVDNVSAWRGLTDINRHKRSRGAGVVVDWQQENGILVRINTERGRNEGILVAACGQRYSFKSVEEREEMTPMVCELLYE